jgi:hypothetical protein
MFRVDIINKTLIKLKPTNFSELGLKERFDIQEWIEKSPNILGEELLVIGKEVILASGKRLDLLCVNKSAALVVVELKRDDSGSSVEWQAIKYASYCSSLLPGEIFKIYASYLNKSELDATKKLRNLLMLTLSHLTRNSRLFWPQRSSTLKSSLQYYGCESMA